MLVYNNSLEAIYFPQKNKVTISFLWKQTRPQFRDYSHPFAVALYNWAMSRLDAVAMQIHACINPLRSRYDIYGSQSTI